MTNVDATTEDMQVDEERNLEVEAILQKYEQKNAKFLADAKPFSKKELAEMRANIGEITGPSAGYFREFRARVLATVDNDLKTRNLKTQPQITLFDDGLGHRVAAFAAEHGSRPLKAHEVENLSQIGSEFTDEEIVHALDITQRLELADSLTRMYLRSMKRVLEMEGR